jgi:hypothetical protein
MHLARATASFAPNARAAPRKQRLGARKIAELRHGDAAQRQCRRIVAQRDALERAERIARRKRPRRSRDQRIHGNRAKLVTPTTVVAAVTSLS